MKQRSIILFAGLGLTLLAVYFAPPPETGGVVASVSRPASGAALARSKAAADAGDADVLELKPRQADLGSESLFRTAEVTTAVAASLPAPVVEASAPELPFRVLGKYTDGADPRVFLDDKGRGLVVRAGDTLHEESYRVDKITDDEIQFTYLPLQKKQTLGLGDVP